MLGKNLKRTWENLPYHSFKRVKLLSITEREKARRIGRWSEEFIIAIMIRTT